MKRMNPVIKGVKRKKESLGGGRGDLLQLLLRWKVTSLHGKTSEIGTLSVGSKPTRCMCKLTDWKKYIEQLSVGTVFKLEMHSMLQSSRSFSYYKTIATYSFCLMMFNCFLLTHKILPLKLILIHFFMYFVVSCKKEDEQGGEISVS